MSRKTLVLLAVGAFAALVAGMALWQWLQPPSAPGLITANGRIEGRITVLSPKTQGRVERLLVDEGQRVRTGEVLAVLRDRALEARVRGLEAARLTAEERLRAAQTQLALARERLPLQVDQAQAALAETQARLGRAQATARNAERDARRYAELVKEHYVSQKAAEAAQLDAVSAEKAVTEAEAARRRATRELALARLVEMQIKADEQTRDALARQVLQAQEALAEAQTLVQDLRIKSPIDGVVLTRTVELGEEVQPGSTLFTLVDPDRLYLKVYIPEPQIGKVALGQEARVYVDAYPGRAFPARVTRIASQAEFTPKNVETREERVKLVFAVELSLLENPGAVLKPGMPADGVIRWQPGAPWKGP